MTSSDVSYTATASNSGATLVLEVALVRERQALEQGQHPGQLPDDAGSAATDQLGRVGVLLVGHHRAAGRERVGDAHEPEARVRPPGDLLGEPAEMDHPEGDRRQRLDHEVAVRDRVERVRADAVEAELRRRRLAIERIAGARQRARPERRDVDPGAGVGESAAVALGHLDVGQQVMREAGPAGPAGCGSCPGRTARPVALGEARRARARSATSAPSSASIERRVQSRRSVATWSLRDRPVWSVRPAARSSSPRAASTFMWTSSRAGSQSTRPGRRSSSASATRPSTSVRDLVRRSGCRPGRGRGRARSSPAMSSAARAASIAIERVKSATRASVSPLNRPPQVRIVPPSCGALMLPGGSGAGRRAGYRSSGHGPRRAGAVEARYGRGRASPTPAGAATPGRRPTARNRPAASSAVRSRCVSASSS